MLRAKTSHLTPEPIGLQVPHLSIRKQRVPIELYILIRPVDPLSVNILAAIRVDDQDTSTLLCLFLPLTLATLLLSLPLTLFLTAPHLLQPAPRDPRQPVRRPPHAPREQR
ncbi:hypothetical protein EVJ58_g2708, partial [Rhodofomes roseus]